MAAYPLKILMGVSTKSFPGLSLSIWEVHADHLITLIEYLNRASAR
jgi:hypothetical protein